MSFRQKFTTPIVPIVVAFAVLGLLVLVMTFAPSNGSTQTRDATRRSVSSPVSPSSVAGDAPVGNASPSNASDPNRVVLGLNDLPDVIGACPAGAITPPTDADATTAASQAAVEYLTTTGQWGSARVDLSYRVGTSTEGFGTMFEQQIPMWCGAAVAGATYAVELTDTTAAWHGTDTRAAVVVSHFADGWQVWGAFHF